MEFQNLHNGSASLADMAVSGRQVGATEHLSSAAPLSAGQAALRPGFRLGRGGRCAVDRGPGRVLDRVGPTREDPRSCLPNFSGSPLLIVTLVLVMAALVSSLAEEVGFRGYFQGILEHQVSGAVAVVIAALLIAPAHGLTQGFVWPILLWYFFVDVMFGAMAYFTKSILPGIVVHSLGLLIFFTLVWPYDQGVTLHFTLRRKNATARRFQCSQWYDGAVKPVAHISSQQMRPALTRYDPSLLSHLCQKDVSLFFEGADHICNDFGGNATRFAHPLEELLQRGAVSLDAMYRSPQCFAGKPIG